MDRLSAIAARHDLVVIEDCAESHGATVRGRTTGALADMGCFSFYANKIITTGEGGMVTTNDDALAERLRLLRNLAFQRPRFLHEHAGHNFRMTGYQAAMGLVQLERIDFILEQKRRVAHAYDRLLAEVSGITTPVERDWARNVYWMYGIVVDEDFPLSRDELAAHLADELAAVPAPPGGLSRRALSGRGAALGAGDVHPLRDRSARHDVGRDRRSHPGGRGGPHVINSLTAQHAGWA
jgi:perosamine synthetase